MDVQVSKHMGAAPAAIASIMFDPQRDPEWIGGARAVERLDSDPHEIGARVRRTGGFLGRKFSWVTELLEFKPVAHEAIVIALPEEHRLAGEERIDLAELADERFILVSRSTAPGFFAHCIELCQRYGFSPAVVEEGNTPAALYGMVAAGLGVSLGPESASIVPWRGVTFKHVTKPSSVEFSVGYRRDDPSRALASFLATVDEVAAELEPSLGPAAN